MGSLRIKVELFLGTTLLLLLANLYLKPYWEHGTLLLGLSRVYGHSTLAHKEVERKKPFDGSEQCPICGHEHVLKLGKKTLTKTWDSKFKLAWIRCSECGHNYVWPYLSDKNLSDIYSTSYSSQASIPAAKLRGNSQFKLLQQLQLVTPEMKHLQVLEQGCAHGAFLNYFANFSQKLICLDPDEDVKARLITGESRQKLTLIRSIEVSDDLVPDNSIDFWLGSHVIEHFADPNRFISSASKKLKLGGVFFQEFPLEVTLPERDAPSNYHLNYFSGKSIHLALTKHGFCQNNLYKLTNLTNKFKGPEYWPDVSKTEIQLTMKQTRMGVFRVVYYKCIF